MKKFTKFCLITSIVLILTGGIVFLLGVVSGGWRMMEEMDEDSNVWRFVRRLENSYMLSWMTDVRLNVVDEVQEELKDVKDEIKEEVKDAWDDAWDDAWEDMDDAWDDAEESAEDARENALRVQEEMEDANREVSEVMKQELFAMVPEGDADIGISASKVRDMKIDIGGAALCFMESENDNFGLKIDGKEDYKYYESKGVFYLEGGKRHFTGNDNTERVYLYIPKGKEFDEVEINVGGGVIYIGELDAREVDLTSGAGIITCEKISCRDLDAEVGAGEVILNGITADKMDMDVGVGTAYVQGKIGMEIDAVCGMGLIAMNLDNAETDFNYEIECTAGEIAVGDKVYHALADDIDVNNRASGKCSLECSMGSISVIFEQK